MPISCKLAPYHLRGDLPLGKQPHCAQNRWERFTSGVLSSPCSSRVYDLNCGWKWKLLAPLRAASQIRLLPRLQHSSKFCSGGVYTAPHANETKCDQSLALELKIPPYEKKRRRRRKSSKPVFRVNTEGSCRKEKKKKKRIDIPLLEDSSCSVYRLIAAINEWWFYLAKKPVFFSFWCSFYCPWSELRCVNGRVREQLRVRASVSAHVLTLTRPAPLSFLESWAEVWFRGASHLGTSFIIWRRIRRESLHNLSITSCSDFF